MGEAQRVGVRVGHTDEGEGEGEDEDEDEGILSSPNSFNKYKILFVTFDLVAKRKEVM